MSERANAYVHTKDDPEDILFRLPPMSRQMSKGDTFTYTPVSDPSIVYKVEQVDYRIKELASGNENNPHDFWASQEVYYGVQEEWPERQIQG